MKRVMTRAAASLLPLVGLASSAAAQASSVLHEGFESPQTIFSYASSGGVTYQVNNAQSSQAGAYSFKVNPSGCAANCFDSYRVDLVHTFPATVRLLGVELWAREGSTSGYGWGGKIRVGHDSTWNLDWWGVVGNNQPITGAWQSAYVNIDELATDVRIRVWDVTNQSSMWLDEVTIFYEQLALTYCAGKLSSQGCTPQIDSTGIPSVSSPSAFLVGASGVVEQVNGLLFYGLGRADLPFQGGTLCVNAPITRTPLQGSGASQPCQGSFAFDFNAWVQSGADPQLTAGTSVNAQYWFRDPQASFGTGLSNALEFLLQP